MSNLGQNEMEIVRRKNVGGLKGKLLMQKKNTEESENLFKNNGTIFGQKNHTIEKKIISIFHVSLLFHSLISQSTRRRPTQ